MTAKELRTLADAKFSEAQGVLAKIGAETDNEKRKALVAEARAKKEEGEEYESQAEIAEDLAKRDAAHIERRKAEDAAAAPVKRVEVRDNGTDRPWAEGLEGFGEFLIAVRDATMGRGFDARLGRAIEEQRASGLQTNVGADGGFLVGTDFSNEIWRRTHETGVLAPQCRTVEITANSNALRVPYVDETSRADGQRWGGIRTYWLQEGAPKEDSKPKFGKWELELVKLAGLAYVTDEMLQDRAIIGNVVMQAFVEELAFDLDSAIFAGAGTGRPTGITGHASTVVVPKEQAQAADSVVWANTAKMFGRVHSRSIRNGRWYINQEVYAQLLLMTSAATSAATPMFVPPGRVADAPFGTLYGRPIEVIEQASALGDVGDISFLDLSEYVLIRKGGIQSAESIHVKFVTDETTFRVVMRVNGAPRWKSALTPYKGAASVSPFVQLEAR